MQSSDLKERIMNESEVKIKKKFEVVALTDEASTKINSLIEQASLKKKGIKISRKDFVNWLIQRLPDNLSSGDMNSLIDNFYKEEIFLRHLLKEIKKNKMDGKSNTEFEIVLKSKKTSNKKDFDDTIVESQDIKIDSAAFENNYSKEKTLNDTD